MRELRIVLTDADEATIAYMGDPKPVIERLVTAALGKYQSTPRTYICPVCGVHDPNAYMRCHRADCTDGRDPR